MASINDNCVMVSQKLILHTFNISESISNELGNSDKFLIAYLLQLKDEYYIHHYYLAVLSFLEGKNKYWFKFFLHKLIIKLEERIIPFISIEIVLNIFSFIIKKSKTVKSSIIRHA